VSVSRCIVSIKLIYSHTKNKPMKFPLILIALGLTCTCGEISAETKNQIPGQNSTTEKNSYLNESSENSELYRGRRRRRRSGKLSSPYSLGGGIATFKTGFGDRTYGLGVDFEYAIKNGNRKYKYSSYGFINGFAPNKHEDSMTITNDESTASQDVGYKAKQSYYQLGLGVKWNFIGQESSIFSTYLKFGVGYMFAPYSIEHDSYDKQGYSNEAYLVRDESGTPSGFLMQFGLGMQVKTDVGTFFIGMDGFIPPTTVNDQEYASSIEGGGSYKLGFRIPLSF